jgi:hypothetical protein
MPEPGRATNPKDAAHTITINADGTWSPSTGVPINAGGVVKFEINYPPNTTNCVIPFGTIRFDSDPKPMIAGGGTVKVGSGG